MDEDQFAYFNDQISMANSSCISCNVDGWFYFGLKFSDEHRMNGWVFFKLHYYMSYHILGLRLLFESLAHTSGGAIGLLNNHMNINNRIKYLMETNEVLSRIFLLPIEEVSFSIMNHLRVLFGFDHLILFSVNQSEYDANFSTLNVPEEVAVVFDRLINETSVLKIKKFVPISTLFVTACDVQFICDYYHVQDVFLIPIVQDDDCIACFFALCYEFKSRFDMSLLHLMVDQISSILYQAEVVKDIVDVKQY